MTLVAFLLVVVSAILHAGWNLFGKKVSPTVGFFTLAFLAGILPLTPLALPMTWLHSDLVYQILPFLIWSGIFQAVYSAALAGAYSLGEISVAYPLARAMPILLVALLSSVMGMASITSVWGYFGISLVLLGSLLLPMHHFRDFSLKHYLNKSTLLALLAAIGTAGYSITDKAAIDILNQNMEQSALIIAVFYIWLEGVSATVFLLLGQVWNANLRSKLGFLILQRTKPLFIAGSMITMTYLLVLCAMQFTENLSYVVALRQISIPIGAVLGVMIFKEFIGLTKILALMLLCAGLGLVILS